LLFFVHETANAEKVIVELKASALYHQDVVDARARVGRVPLGRASFVDARRAEAILNEFTLVLEK